VHLEPSRELEALDTFVNNIIKKRWCNINIGTFEVRWIDI
jgi:hypothetical protein